METLVAIFTTDTICAIKSHSQSQTILSSWLAGDIQRLKDVEG
jgi:hypothetical protein